jgi:23S rRNA (cytosine1962-C5)-methyltransferase
VNAPGSGHRLLDFGGGARLERFGERMLDRPAPGALGPRGFPERWRAADLTFSRERGWLGAGAMEAWPIEFDGLMVDVRPTETGQVGLFPEHGSMLPWLRENVIERTGDPNAPPPRVLNLFAYTGVATLALARAGAAVTHVDASRPTVAWARRNAERSGLADRPIRWIVDDAVAFTNREVRRERRYAGVVLDPPTYGHGPGGRDWRIETDLLPLLEAMADVLEPDGFALLTAHTPDLGPERLGEMIQATLGRTARFVDVGPLFLATPDGRRLDLGGFARVSRRS